MKCYQLNSKLRKLILINDHHEDNKKVKIHIRNMSHQDIDLLMQTQRQIEDMLP